MHEPIIDTTREPVSRWRRSRVHTPITATARFVWFSFLRPLILLLVWMAALDYLHSEFVASVMASPDDAQFLRICAWSVLLLLGVMLIVARAVRDREDRENTETGTVAPAWRLRRLATAAKVPVRQLFAWQRARKLTALHDDDGHLRDVVVEPIAPLVPAAPDDQRR